MQLVFEKVAAAAECSLAVQRGCMPMEGGREEEAQALLVVLAVLEEQEVGLITQKVKH